MTPTEASQRKSELMASPEWRDKFLSGSPAAASEMRDLDAKIIAGGNPVDVDLAMSGKLDDAPFQSTQRRQMIGTAEMLREAGIDDNAIRNTLLGKGVTLEEQQAAKAQKAALLRSSDFTTKFMAGDGEARKQMLELDLVLSSPVAASQ